MLISYEFSSKEKHPNTNQSIINGVERPVVCEVDRSREPLNENKLIVCNEEEIEQFNEDPMIMFFDVDPSIVLSSSLEASLSSKIKGMFAAPEDHHSKHYLLPKSNRHFSTLFLMVKIMKSISDWQ